MSIWQQLCVYAIGLLLCYLGWRHDQRKIDKEYTQ